MRLLADKALLYLWGLQEIARLGIPDVTLGFFGGAGDDLLCTAPIEEHLRRGARRIWFFTRHPLLYTHYDKRVRLIPEDPRYIWLAARLGVPIRHLSYSEYDATSDQDTACKRHILAEICSRAGLSGKITLRPYLRLSPDELSWGKPFAGCIVVQSGGMAAAVPMSNKQWPAECMQAVVGRLNDKHKIVHIGSTHDTQLSGVMDMRGATSQRQTASILAQARLFIGLVGFPMHLARAVDCPAVIVYGGREPPEISGYNSYLNVVNQPKCAPCWQRNHCEYDRVCLRAISSEQVYAEVIKNLAFPRAELAAEIYNL